MDTAAIDAALQEARRLVPPGTHSQQLAEVVQTWEAAKAAAAHTPEIAETQAAILRAGQHRLSEAVDIVREAATD
jgi:hypothetical protein